MIRLSDTAQELLDRYLEHIRACLRGCKTVDADEVERNIIEHIDSELEGATAAVSFEQLDAVLKRLGSPRQWIPEEELPWWRRIMPTFRADVEDLHRPVPTLKAVWLGWEKLRILYNAILLVEGLIGLWFLRHLGEKVGHRCPNVFGSHVWITIIIFAALANALYCLGPLAEISLVDLRVRWSRRERRLLFAAGLLFSMLIILAFAIRGYTHISGYGR
jgi:hypothetical protein